MTTTTIITAGTIYEHPRLGRVTAMLSGVDVDGDATVHVHDWDEMGTVPANDLTEVES